jgi:hypothetical protein
MTRLSRWAAIACWAAAACVWLLAVPAGADPAPADTSISTPGERPGESVLDSLLAEPEEESDLADTSRVHLELGARLDVTNESYYEDAFIDTTFLGRKLVNTPERRYAGVLVTTWDGTRGMRASRYSLLTEVEAGDLIQRGVAALRWKSPLAESWSLHLDPSFEARHDRTFDRDLEEWRTSVSGRLRHDFTDGLTGADLGLRGDLLRSSGQGSEFLLDRNSAAASAAIDHLSLAGDEWRLGYSLTGRAFPDSTERNHLEHSGEGRIHWAGDGVRPATTLETMVTRRSTFESAATSRDNYWNLEGALDARWGGGGAWPITAGLGGELFRYDLQDSTLFFDYAIARARAAVRWEPGGRWSLALGPRGEVLDADLSPGERYQEIGAALEAERLGAGSWWSAELSSGWRDYDSTPAAGPHTPSLHSSFAFEEVELTADQPLARHVKLRILALLRWERHVVRAQDAGSVYLSSELRWLP